MEGGRLTGSRLKEVGLYLKDRPCDHCNHYGMCRLQLCTPSFSISNMIIKMAKFVQITGSSFSNQKWNPSLTQRRLISHIVVGTVFFVIGQNYLHEGKMLKGKTTFKQNDHNFTEKLTAKDQLVCVLMHMVVFFFLFIGIIAKDKLVPGFIKDTTIFLGTFQGPPTGNVISQIEQKCT